MANLILNDLKKGDKIYYARIIPTTDIYEVGDLIIRMVADTWLSATDKRSKQAYIFSNKQLNEDIFMKREDALKKVIEAEKKYRSMKRDDKKSSDSFDNEVINSIHNH